MLFTNSCGFLFLDIDPLNLLITIPLMEEMGTVATGTPFANASGTIFGDPSDLEVITNISIVL